MSNLLTQISRTDLTNFTIEVLRLHEPNILGTPFRIARGRVWHKIEVTDNLRNRLRKFHEADVLANTGARALAEL